MGVWTALKLLFGALPKEIVRLLFAGVVLPGSCRAFVLDAFLLSKGGNRNEAGESQHLAQTTPKEEEHRRTVGSQFLL